MSTGASSAPVRSAHASHGRVSRAVMLDWPETVALHVVMAGAAYLCYYSTSYLGYEFVSAVEALRGAPTILEPQRAL